MLGGLHTNSVQLCPSSWMPFSGKFHLSSTRSAQRPTLACTHRSETRNGMYQCSEILISLEHQRTPLAMKLGKGFYPGFDHTRIVSFLWCVTTRDVCSNTTLAVSPKISAYILINGMNSFFFSMTLLKYNSSTPSQREAKSTTYPYLASLTTSCTEGMSPPVLGLAVAPIETLPTTWPGNMPTGHSTV